MNKLILLYSIAVCILSICGFLEKGEPSKKMINTSLTVMLIGAMLIMLRVLGVLD